MLAQQLREYFTKQLQSTKSDFLNDMAAFEEGQLAVSPGGSARSPLDLAVEVAYVNRRMSQRIRGEEPEKWPDSGWMKAPADFDGVAAREAVASSIDEVIAAWSALPDDELMRPIQLATEVTNPLDLVVLVCTHTGYHDGQLNYLQSFYGDVKLHW
jgi:uncharacterized damage-inducible protein DinB